MAVSGSQRGTGGDVPILTAAGDLAVITRPFQVHNVEQVVMSTWLSK